MKWVKPASRNLIYVLIFLLANLWGLQAQGDEIRKIGIGLNRLNWEFSAGIHSSKPVITSNPGIDQGATFTERSSAGFQAAFTPVFNIGKDFSARTGLSISARKHMYVQESPWVAEYTEKITMAGIPAYMQYSFGYTDIRFHLLGGFQLNIPLVTTLDYSIQSIPGFEQAGSVPISFDRKRLVPEIQFGGGVKFYAGGYYLGIELLYYVGLSTYSRFDPSRTVFLYSDLEPVIEFYSPEFRTHGIQLNLSILKWKG